ncbi:MAG: 50S ribosomal protein L18 [Nanoarchaeota archaeon]
MVHTVRQRRLEAKTDYKARLAMLKSGKPRLVIRKTNSYMIVQIVETKVAQDSILFGVTSKDLLANGWSNDKKGSLKSLPACYLTGLLIGKKAKEKIKSAILDIGMNRNIQKSRIYAVLKGTVDSGLNIPHDEKTLPTLDEINKNKDFEQIFKKIKDKI